MKSAVIYRLCPLSEFSICLLNVIPCTPRYTYLACGILHTHLTSLYFMYFTSPHLISPHLPSSSHLHLTSPHTTSPHLASSPAHLTSPHPLSFTLPDPSPPYHTSTSLTHHTHYSGCRCAVLPLWVDVSLRGILLGAFVRQQQLHWAVDRVTKSVCGVCAKEVCKFRLWCLRKRSTQVSALMC